MREVHKYYWTCEYCGANLDPGEKCDCPESTGLDTDYSDVNYPIYKKEGGEENERTSVACR